MYVVNTCTVTPVRQEPSEGSEQLTQLLFGEVCEVLDRLPRWTKIRSTLDGQEGWVDFKMVEHVGDEAIRRLGDEAKVAHYDMRWLKPMDEQLLHEIGKRFTTIITVEDGVISGGLGSAVLEFMADNGYTPHVIRLGVNDQFVEHGSTKELYHLLKLDREGICESLLQALEQ